ncbi:MAG: hypothetical protein SXQ77_02210 [Halobacteria archaeon]|nr:hypothetical protein [Halobacteria archaeon]
MVDRFEEIEELCEFAEVMSSKPVTQELGKEVVEDADITPAEGRVPHQILEYISDRLTKSERVEGFTCTLHSPSRIEAYYEAIVGEGVVLDVVTTEQVVEYLRSEHNDKLTSAIESGNLRIHAIDGEIPFTTLVFDRQDVAVLLFESDADMKGITSIKCLITNGSTEAVEWAVQKTEAYKDRSKTVELTNLES